MIERTDDSPRNECFRSHEAGSLFVAPAPNCLRDRNKAKRVLVFIVAYEAEQTIEQVLCRIPASLNSYNTEVLIIDDSSGDETFRRARNYERRGDALFPVTVLSNPANQGYGGNQKLGFQYAIQHDFDFVALVHGDGQYAPECLPALLQPLLDGSADAVFGSRMMERGAALKGGMPLYKYYGNRILTFIQNKLLRSTLSEFHSGYRLYSTAALRNIPFDRNTNDFHFDTEIIVQFHRAGLRIKELPIPTYYGTEICRVNGLRYGLNAVKATLLSRAQDLGVLYQHKFAVTAPLEKNPLYQAKLTFESPHTLTVDRVKPGSAVVDVGCASGYMSAALKERNCRITGIDQFAPGEPSGLDKFIRADLDVTRFPVDAGAFDYVLLLDVIEHLRSPEQFLDSLRQSRSGCGDLKVIVSTGNVAFIATRLSLLFGSFNYGVRGILDLTHTRLFTFATVRQLFEQGGYRIEEVRGVPAPFPLAFGPGIFGRMALAVNRALIGISKALFSYQIYMVCSPLPTVGSLLAKAHESQSLSDEDWQARRLSKIAS